MWLRINNAFWVVVLILNLSPTKTVERNIKLINFYAHLTSCPFYLTCKNKGRKLKYLITRINSKIIKQQNIYLHLLIDSVLTINVRVSLTPYDEHSVRTKRHIYDHASLMPLAATLTVKFGTNRNWRQNGFQIFNWQKCISS